MSFTRKAVGAALVAGGATVVMNRVLRARPPAQPAPAPGMPRRWGWRHADLFFTVRGTGLPLLLLHDLYTGASGEEMAALGDRLEGEATIVTLDLPGFGRSGKPAMRYQPELFIDAIVEFARHVLDGPVLVAGSGLAGAYAAEAALRLGRAARGVVLLGPPEVPEPATNVGSSWGPILYQTLRTPLGVLYHHVHAVASWRRHALRGSLAAEPPDLAERADRLHRHAAQPGAEWALWSLWSGDLARDPRPALARLDVPTLVLWGAETSGDPAAPEYYRAARREIEQQVVPGTARWPHVDDPERTARAISAWRTTHDAASFPQPPHNAG